MNAASTTPGGADARHTHWLTRLTPGGQGALGVGLLALVVSLARVMNEPTWPTDFDQWYHAARALLHGSNPYDAVGPTGTFRWEWPLNYPLSTVLFTAPLSLLSLPAARVVFATAGGAVLGYALGRDGFRRIGLVFSAAFLIAVARNQWSPFYTAAFFAPWAVVFLAAKPNMAVGYVASIATWRQLTRVIVVLMLLAGLSVAVRPEWPREWIGALRQMTFVVAPIMRPGGWLLALALLKWRRPDARLLLALACVPQTPSLYDLLPLFVITATVRQVSVLSLLTHMLFFLIVILGPFASFNDYAFALGNATVFVVYLPVLIMLMRRPNVFRDEVEPVSPTESGPLGLSLRARIEVLPRVDAWLLLVNVAASMVLFWLSVSTRRV